MGGPLKPPTAEEIQAAVSGRTAAGGVENLSRLPFISFASRNIQPPSTLYVTPDDFLLVNAVNSVSTQSIDISGRLLQPDGSLKPFLFNVTPGSARAGTSKAFSLAEGFLLDLFVIPHLDPPITRRGQTYCTVLLQRGGTTTAQFIALLFQGYVGHLIFGGWPAGMGTDAISGPGAILSVAGSTPAAGAEISVAVPSGAQWSPQTLIFTLTASAGVATREVTLQITDGTNVLWQDAVEGTQLATIVRTYSYSVDGGSDQTSFTLGSIRRTLPKLRMLPGWKFVTSTSGIDVADQYSAIRVSVEEWLDA